MHAPEEHWIDTPRGRVFAQQWQPAAREDISLAPIVLLHDSLGCVALWRDFPAQLAEATGRAVIAYDRLGFGRSDPHPGLLAEDFIHAEATGAFAAVRNQLGIDRFIAFGHSVGGGMAVGCAAAWPGACIALITESAQAFVEDRTLQGIRDAQQAFSDSAQRDRLRRYHGDKADWVLHAWIDTWLAPSFAAWTLDDDLRLVQCPALVLHGDKDEYGSPAHPRRIASQVAGPATLDILAGYGHVPHREHPREVLARVAAWLSDVTGGNPRSDAKS